MSNFACITCYMTIYACICECITISLFSILVNSFISTHKFYSVFPQAPHPTGKGGMSKWCGAQPRARFNHSHQLCNLCIKMKKLKHFKNSELLQKTSSNQQLKQIQGVHIYLRPNSFSKHCYSNTINFKLKVTA